MIATASLTRPTRSRPLSNPDAGTGTAVLERPEEETKLDDGGNGDADRFAHYVSRDRIALSPLSHRPTGGGVVRQGVGAEA